VNACLVRSFVFAGVRTRHARVRAPQLAEILFSA
jgi:hypothetical protein